MIQGWVLVPNTTLKAEIEAIENPAPWGGWVRCRKIDNPLADTLGVGTILNLWVFPTRVLEVPVWNDWFESKDLDTFEVESDMLFLPPDF